MKNKILIILVVAIFLFIQSGCSNESSKANELFGDVNKYIADYGKIETIEIDPLRTEINKNDGSKSGSKKSVKCVNKILAKVGNQSKILNEAKKKLQQILDLNVSKDITKYAKLTDDALNADLDILNASKKLYLQLNKMYSLASENNLSQMEYEKINNDVQSLSESVTSLEQVRQKLHSKKDLFYKSNLENK